MGLGACPCGGALIASPVGAHSILPWKDVEACWEKPLPELGLEPGEALGVSKGDGWSYFFLAGEPRLESAQPSAATIATDHPEEQQHYG